MNPTTKNKTGLQKYTYLYELYMWTRSGVDLGNIFDLDGIKRFDSQRNDKHTYAFKNKIHNTNCMVENFQMKQQQQ